MKYDFTTILDRKGKDAVAVDGMEKISGFVEEDSEFSGIPMWIADMNFPVVPKIQETISKRLQHPTFGYFSVREEYYDAILTWQRERNGVTDLNKEAIGYENGVLGGVISAISAFASAGDAVLLHSPTYIGFTKAITNSGFRIVHSPLKKDEDHVWRIDYEDMEEKIRTNQIHVVVFCNPHNPCGRVWEKEELEKLVEVCKRNDCVIVVDEIWSDLTLGEHCYLPLESLNEEAKKRTIAFYAPSKTFNLSGLIGSYHIIYDKYLRDRVVSQSGKCHYNHMNVLSMHALLGAYSKEGMEWLDELKAVLGENVDTMCEYLKESVPEVEVYKPQGTYMLFLECKQWCETYKVSFEELLRRGWKVGVIWQDGRPFGKEEAVRMNLALPHSKIEEVVDRLKKYVFVG